MKIFFLTVSTIMLLLTISEKVKETKETYAVCYCMATLAVLLTDLFSKMF